MIDQDQDIFKDHDIKDLNTRLEGSASENYKEQFDTNDLDTSAMV